MVQHDWPKTSDLVDMKETMNAEMKQMMKDFTEKMTRASVEQTALIIGSNAKIAEIKQQNAGLVGQISSMQLRIDQLEKSPSLGGSARGGDGRGQGSRCSTPGSTVERPPGLDAVMDAEEEQFCMDAVIAEKWWVMDKHGWVRCLLCAKWYGDEDDHLGTDNHKKRAAKARSSQLSEKVECRERIQEDLVRCSFVAAQLKKLDELRM